MRLGAEMTPKTFATVLTLSAIFISIIFIIVGDKLGAIYWILFANMLWIASYFEELLEVLRWRRI